MSPATIVIIAIISVWCIVSIILIVKKKTGGCSSSAFCGGDCAHCTKGHRFGIDKDDDE